MKILIYGAGGVGLGLASFLIKSKQEVHLIARPQAVNALKAKGLSRTGILGNFSATPYQFSCFSSLKDTPGIHYDFILISTKSYDSESAAEDLSNHKPLFHEKTRIVLCQNGWGNAEIFTKSFSKEQIYNARIITGFRRVQPHEVQITVHAEPAKIGSLFHNNTDEILPLCHAISDGDLPCEPTKEIAKDLWTKMLYNCTLNSLGSIFDVSYGRLGESEYTRFLMESVIKEIFTVLTKAGYQTHWQTVEEYIQFFYTKQLAPTANHISSTLQGIKVGKRTEIDSLNGIVIKLGESLGIDTPYNRMAYYGVKFLEQKFANQLKS